MSACARAARRTSSGVAASASIDRRRAVSRAVLSAKPLASRPSSASRVGSAEGKTAVSDGSGTSWAEVGGTAAMNSRNDIAAKAHGCRGTPGRLLERRPTLTTLPGPPITLVFHQVRSSSLEITRTNLGDVGRPDQTGPGRSPHVAVDVWQMRRAGHRCGRRPALEKGSDQQGAKTTCSTAAGERCSDRSSACPRSSCSRR